MAQTKRKSQISTLFKSLGGTINEYIPASSITGLKYLQDEKATFLTKLFWCVVIIVSFIFCNILVAHFWVRYKSNSTRMTVASNHIPLSALKLPAITFCSIGEIDSSRLTAFIQQNNLQSNAFSKEDLSRIFRQSAGFFTTIEYDVSDLQTLQQIIETNRFSIENVMNMIQTSCDELFVRCQFEGRLVDCASLFVPVTSQYGNCCSFNRNGQYNSSRENGRISMSVLLRPSREAFTSSETLRFLMYESNTSASVSLFESLLARQTETFIELTPELIVCSDDVGKTSISQRNCLYEWERQLKYFANYRELNCRLECILAKIESKCQCLPYYYAMYSQTTRMCNFNDIKCLVDKFWSDKELDTCDCMENCVGVSYQAVSNQTPLNIQNFTIGSFYDGVTPEHMTVHVSFGKQVFKATRKDLSTNILALTANLGGIYSLFIGFSAITFVEIIYYVCVRFYLNYKRTLTATTTATTTSKANTIQRR